MADSDSSDEDLAEFLRLRGHSDEEVDKIVRRLAEHDSATARQSVFDSIEAGSFDLDAIIEEALRASDDQARDDQASNDQARDDED